MRFKPIKIIDCIVIAILFCGITFVLFQGVVRNEKVECMEWEVFKSQFDGWYSTDWQIRQCRQHGIEI